MQGSDLNKLDWNLLRAFACVVELGSLTRAANHLGLSQPTLSRQIAALETQLGAPLFERIGRSLRPTELAQALQESAQRMQAAVAALGSVHGPQPGPLDGTVRLSASAVLATYVLPGVVARLAQQHAGIEIELVAGQQPELQLRREPDLSLLLGKPTQGAVISRFLGEWPMGLYAHRDYLARVGGTIDPARLHSYRWVGLDVNMQMVEGFRAAGHDIDRHFFHFRTDNHVVGVEAVRAGVGIGVLSQPVAQTDPNLVRVLPSQPMPLLPVWLEAHRDLRGANRLRLVFDFIAEELQALGAGNTPQPTQRPPLTSSKAPVL